MCERSQGATVCRTLATKKSQENKKSNAFKGGQIMLFKFGTVFHARFKFFSALVLMLSFVLFGGGIYAQEATTGKQHAIKMVAEEIEGGYLAYRMMQHEIVDETGTTDVTAKYSETVTIPGPTIFITEGDVVDIELFHAIDPGSPG
tara:strand:+ start:237 stop:674 length:438 start_codon:yes stop_codon:yes gene_type:complete